MIFENELKTAGFTLDNNQLRYEYSDFEELRATVREHDCADGSKALEVRDLRIANPMDEGVCYMLISYPLYFRNINNFFALLTLLNYPIRIEDTDKISSASTVDEILNYYKNFSETKKGVV